MMSRLFCFLGFTLLLSCELWSQTPNELTLSEKDNRNLRLQVIELELKQYVKRLPAYATVVDPQMLLDARANWLSAYALWEKSKIALSYSQINYERQKNLFENNQNVSEKTFQMAETAYLTAQIEEKSNCALLHNLKDSIQVSWGSKILEWIVEDSLKIENLAQQHIFLLHVSLATLESLIQTPSVAYILLFPHEIKEVSLVSVAPKMNYFQNKSYFYLAESVNKELMPGMNVQAFMPSSSVLEGVVVPFSAIVVWLGKSWVFVQTKKGTFVKREISTDYPVKEGFFVHKELKAKERIVMVGAQELLSSELIFQMSPAEND